MSQTEAIVANNSLKKIYKMYVIALASLLLTSIFGLEAAAQSLTTIERNGPSEKRVDIVIIGRI